MHRVDHRVVVVLGSDSNSAISGPTVTGGDRIKAIHNMDTLLIGMEDTWEGWLLSLIVAYTTFRGMK